MIDKKKMQLMVDKKKSQGYVVTNFAYVAQ